MKCSAGSRRTTSEIRWRRTSAVTRPMPAPTSNALVLGVNEMGASGRMADGTTQRSGNSCMRNWREPRASTRGRVCKMCHKLDVETWRQLAYSTSIATWEQLRSMLMQNNLSTSTDPIRHPMLLVGCSSNQYRLQALAQTFRNSSGARSVQATPISDCENIFLVVYQSPYT
jgi:hypothetical protein